MKMSRSTSGPTTAAYLLYEDKAPRDAVQWLVIALVLTLTLAPGVVFLFFDVAAAAILLGLTALDALMFCLILPRRYQVYNTKMRIVLGWPLSWSIPLSTISEARPASAFDTWAYAGIRLATSSKTAVEIVRRRGMNVVISPANRDVFLDRVNEAVRQVDSGLGQV